MPMPRHALAAAFAAVLSLSVAACARDAGDTATDAAVPEAAPAGTVAPPAGGPETPSDDIAAAVPAADAADPAGPCNADAVQSLVGQEATEAVLEQARRDSGSNTVRALKPGQPATMDFRPDRLDIALDDNNVIQSLRCG